MPCLPAARMFTVGGEVFANHTCDYGGLFGTVTEIRTGPDQCTERDEPDICCDLQPPESETMVMEIKDRFSALFGYPKQLEDLGLDCVILAPSMLEPMLEDLPAEDGQASFPHLLLRQRQRVRRSDAGSLQRHGPFASQNAGGPGHL